MRNYDKIARQLIGDARKPAADRLIELTRMCPELVQQIKQDQGPSGPLIFWGQCRNLDELAGSVIVDSSILELIFEIAGQRFDQDRIHAGLQHAYGYLFSIIDTPYGKKRDRWVTTSLESALGLPGDVLGPAPSSGTLLANATWLAGNIAFRNIPRLRWLQRCLNKRVAPSLGNLKLDHLPRLRTTEVVVLPKIRGSQARVSLITDLVKMPKADSAGACWLLVYSVNDDRLRNAELVTLFTVSNAFVDSIRDRAANRKLSDICLRYNAWVAGFPQEPQTGTIRVSES